MKPIQYFSDECLANTRKSTPSQIADFLDQFIQMNGRHAPKMETSQLISIRMPSSLLKAVKARAKEENLPYQTWIKSLLEKRIEKEFLTKF